MGARYYDPTVGRFTQPEPAWSNPMFNSMGGRNLLVRRTYGTGTMVGQETTPIPGGYYRPASQYNWYSYSRNDPINHSDVSGYWDWGKTYGVVLMVGGGVMIAGGALGVYAALHTGPFAPFAAVPGLIVIYGGVGLVFTVIEKTFDRDMPDLPFIP